jgi:hypothetical protein
MSAISAISLNRDVQEFSGGLVSSHTVATNGLGQAVPTVYGTDGLGAIFVKAGLPRHIALDVIARAEDAMAADPNDLTATFALYSAADSAAEEYAAILEEPLMAVDAELHQTQARPGLGIT